ncbi:MAG TPA: DUF4402 domain-containing protein [Longimicrobium sp.]|nr:DUF4402 domain-containing protein [Longimicrobium sp.]
MAKRFAVLSLRRGPGAWWLSIALLALFARPCPAPAQGTVSVLPVQGLRFGTLASGIPTVVSPLDGGRRASIELVGAGHVTVSFELPAGLMTGSAGPLLPLRFGGTDGRVTFPRAGGSLVFDPAAPVSFDIPPGSGGATVWLGGAAEPGPRQAPGVYSASITVNVVVANPAT